MSKSKKKCARCNKPSLPGLNGTRGLCQFHWDEAHWGTEWAKKCETARNADAPKREAEHERK